MITSDSSCQCFLDAHSCLLPTSTPLLLLPTWMHDFSELSGWHWHGFHTLLCFSGLLALHSLLYLVWMSLQKEPLWRVRTGRDTVSASVPHLGASLHTSLCMSAMWQEHAGASLPFPRHLRAGMQVHKGEGCRRHGFKLGVLRLGSSWKSDATIFIVLLMPGSLLLPTGLNSERSDSGISLTLSERQVEHRAKDSFSPLLPCNSVLVHISSHHLPAVLASKWQAYCAFIPLFSSGRGDHGRKRMHYLAKLVQILPTSLPNCAAMDR